LNQKYIQEAHTIDRLDKALDKNLELSEMYYNRALVYMYLYEYENGLTDLETAIEIAGTDTSQRDHLPQYTFSQSIALYYMGKLDESLAKVNQAIELAKSQEFKDSFEGIIPTYLVQRACVYDRMYRYEEATKDRKHAKEKIPTINTTPFHIRLLDNDVVANIMSYMDGQTIVNTAMASRQLNAVFKTLEVNPLVYKDENTYMYMELGQYHEFLLLTAPQLKRILCYRYTNGHARVFKELYSTNKYVKEIKYWKDHNPVHREKECAELIKYFGEYMKDSYRVNRFCLPSNLKSRLEKEGKKLGKLLFKLGVHSIASMIEMIKDKGPLLVVVFYQGVYYAGYISQSSSIEAEQFVTDREAWLWRADKDTVHRVLIPEHAVVFAPYRNGLYFGGESEHEDYPNAALSCMMSTASFNANGVFEGWDVSDAELDPELNAYDCYASIYSVHSSH
jgi:tetratricopeptide (TPR) repeat protein